MNNHLYKEASVVGSAVMTLQEFQQDNLLQTWVTVIALHTSQML